MFKDSDQILSTPVTYLKQEVGNVALGLVTLTACPIQIQCMYCYYFFEQTSCFFVHDWCFKGLFTRGVLIIIITREVLYRHSLVNSRSPLVSTRLLVHKPKEWVLDRHYTCPLVFQIMNKGEMSACRKQSKHCRRCRSMFLYCFIIM